MKRVLFIGMICAALVCAFSLPSLYAVDAPADMELTVPAGAKATKTPVAFSHKGHNMYKCQECHHKWDGQGELKSCSAAGCHADTSKKNKKGDDSFYRAFHDSKSMKSCVGCHKILKKEKKPTGPTSCTKCHPKK